MRYTIHALLLLLPGCSFFSNLTGNMGGTGMTMTVDMSKYHVESIDLAFPEREGGLLCPGESATFKVLARGHKKKTPESPLTLETVSSSTAAADARGKMDLTDFAMEGRGGSVNEGVFSPDPDPWNALLGYDVRATYRFDESKKDTVHFDPTYTCIRSVGSSGASGAEGEQGMFAEAEGGAGGMGGPGGAGGAGPGLTAYVTVVRTPKYDRVGLVQITGDVEQLLPFDLGTGVTVSAAGGSGGPGGYGGDGGQGHDPQGAGGPGGPGGQGGPGGDGGQVLIVLDDRFPELASIVRVDVSGGPPGYGGGGGNGGAGGPAPEKACDDCDEPEPGPDGAGGPAGPDGTESGRPGGFEVRAGDVSQAFASLPKGVRMRDEPRPTPPPPAPKPTPRKKPRRR